MPVFEDLLPPEHNKVVLDLLFQLAEWHAYAKLRQHTDHTLDFMEHSTTLLGQIIRQFATKTCNAFVTKELPQEHIARGRRKSAAEAKKAASGDATTANTSTGRTSKGAKIKLFNLQTYKLHALGDYVRTIRRFGTTDSYSTQTVRRFEFFNDFIFYC